MKRLPVVLAALLALAAPLAAAERQGTDLFAGYSFAKIDDVNRNGANAALGFDLFGPVDGFVDASAHWGSAEGTSRDDLTLMAGPGVRFGKRGGTVIFVRVLAGLVKDRASITVLDVDISESRAASASWPAAASTSRSRGSSRRARAGRLLSGTPAAERPTASRSGAPRGTATGRAASVSRPASSTASGSPREGESPIVRRRDGSDGGRGARRLRRRVAPRRPSPSTPAPTPGPLRASASCACP